MAERETELKSLLKTWLKTQHKKRKIMASSPITSWQIDGEIMEPVQFSHSTMSNSLQPDVLQHTRLPYPSPTPGDFSNSSPLSQWCHPTIPPSVIPFLSYLPSFPASGSFPMSQFFTSSGQSIGDSTSASVLPTNIQD